MVMSDRSVLTIGNFDGVHLGHQAIVKRARVMADEVGAIVKAVTFHPHPAGVLGESRGPRGILGIHDKVGYLKAAGCDRVVVITPCRQLLEMAPRDFIEMLLVDHGAVGFVEGEDFRFGKNRGGDVALLEEMSQGRGFEVAIVGEQRVCLDDQLTVNVSSTFIRELILRGRVSDAKRCMGRAFEVRGRVVAGEKMGRTLGMPTLNIDWSHLADRVFVPHGVYGGRVMLPDQRERLGAISVGEKPTLGGRGGTVLEVHLLDFEGDLYDQEVTVGFARWVRGQVKFPDVQELKKQLGRDVEKIRSWGELGVF